MNDASTKLSVPVAHKARTIIRGGRGSHSKNKTWVSGRASVSPSPSPAPEGRWERGRAGVVMRARGGRGPHVGVNGHGHASYSAAGSANVTEDEASSAAPDAGPSTLVAAPHPPPLSANGNGKTWEELVKMREEERTRAIREGKMDDPMKPKRLEEAITIVGTCQDMCPEFERYRRERENNLDKWECILGPDGKPTKKVDHSRAVKIYERGQGDKIIPSDLRPAPVLKRTLDYLFHELIPRGGFAETQAFVRDRSRAVRNDFTIQQDMGAIAMECHERCTRFHIISLHLMYGVTSFDRALEMQQLMNSLLSLKEFYDDQRGVYESPNELEMRIYHRLGLIRDQHERNDRPPPHIAGDEAFQLVTRFRSEVQRASVPITKTSRMRVSPEAMQTFAELANVLRGRRNMIMIYLMACFLEHIFGTDTIEDIEAIRGALTIQDIIDARSDAEGHYEVEEDVGIVDVDEEMAPWEDEEGDDELDAFIEEVDDVQETDNVGPVDSQPPDEEAPIPSPIKRGTTQWITENFGNVPTLPRDENITQSRSAPGLSSSLPFGDSSTQPSAAVPPNTTVFGKLVSSSTTPSVFGGKPGPSSVFNTALSAFGARPNVFGGPIFGVPSSSDASPAAPPKFPEPAKETPSPSPFSIQPSASTILQETKPLRSLADAAPLQSSGEEDQVKPSEAVKIEKPPPFASSQSAPVLNSEAPGSEPGDLRASQSSTPFAAGSRATLTPIRTDSLLKRMVDPTRGVFVTPVESPSDPFKVHNGPPLSINTDSALKSTTETRKTYALDSPVGPPPLHRKSTISLPGTPTGSFSTASMPPVDPTTPSTPYDFPTLRVNISSTLTSTPSADASSSSRMMGQPGPSLTPNRRPPISSSPLKNGAFGVRDEDPMHSVRSPGSKRKLKEQADAFIRAHSLVPVVYRRWKQKMADNAAWKEACQRSESYKQKLHESTTDSSISSIPSSSSFKRQRSATELEAEAPKRPRRHHKRVSNPMAERLTDEELAEKLMQNKEKHERRWARGLFVKAIQDYVHSRTKDVPSNWATWLCMNPDNDKTAIWLEQKFDVPQSGSWESEAVFNIPVSATPPSQVFPGLIVFECTPLEEVDDEIERKYRILDDCSRLRDVMASLPEDRHYTPSLLFINWDPKSGSDTDSDLSHMVVKYIEDGILRSSSSVTMSSDDTDEAFSSGLSSLHADMQGDLVEKLSLSNFFERLSLPWKEAMSIWVAVCFSDEIFNWPMFSHVVESFVESLNTMLEILLSVWNNGSVRASLLLLPHFETDRDEHSVVNVLHEWLRSSGLGTDSLLYTSLAAGFNQESEARAFFLELLDLALLNVRRSVHDAKQRRVIPKTRLHDASLQFTDALQQTDEHLRSVIKTLPRPSPKRKMNGVATNGSAPGGSVSQTSSPSPSTPSKGAMRAQPSQSFDSLSDDQEHEESLNVPVSPTSSIATSVGNSSVSGITAAMLRALSRDVLKRYGGSKVKRESRS